MKCLIAFALAMLCGVAFGSEEEVVPPEIDFSPATLELELTEGTNRADGTFFGFDFDKPIEKYPHRGNDFWCKIGTAWMCGGKDGKCKHEDHYLVDAELKNPFHGFTNLTVKCEYGGERKCKATALEFLREVPGMADYEANEKWMRDLQSDIEGHCDVGWFDNSNWNEKLNTIRLSSTKDGQSGLAVETAVCSISGMTKGNGGRRIGKPCTMYWLKVYRVKGNATGK